MALQPGVVTRSEMLNVIPGLFLLVGGSILSLGSLKASQMYSRRPIVRRWIYPVSGIGQCRDATSGDTCSSRLGAGIEDGQTPSIVSDLTDASVISSCIFC